MPPSGCLMACTVEDSVMPALHASSSMDPRTQQGNSRLEVALPLCASLCSSASGSHLSSLYVVPGVTQGMKSGCVLATKEWSSLLTSPQEAAQKLYESIG